MNILLVAKRPKFDYEQSLLGLSNDDMIAKYQNEGANWEKILSSRARQLCAKSDLERELGIKGINLNEFNALNLSQDRPDLLLVLGGDESFKAVAARSKDIPVVGINSDPQTSVGFLTKWDVATQERVNNLVDAIQNQKYNIEEWTRLKCNLLSVPTISELYLGETKRKDMSRHILEYRGQKHEQKSSGLIVATGAGDTGWYNSATNNRVDNTFKPTDPRARFLVTEPYRYNKDARLPLWEGSLEHGEDLIVHSLNDDGGLVSGDSWWEAKFSRGTTATIRLGDPAKVIIPEK